MAKILLKCHDIIGETMAGPAIRYWEFANALSKNHEVILQVPKPTSIRSPHFKILSVKEPLNLANIDIIISQLIDPKTALLAKYHGVRLIYDAYDPEPLEHLEIFKSHPSKRRTFYNHKIINTVNFSLQMADGYLCANEKQRDLWTGFLLSLRKISPRLYDRDSDLNKTLGIVPFGIPSQAPKKEKPGFRQQFNLKATDKLLIWGGGIWNWFDPLTLISAIKILADKRDDIKLVFMGMIHPNAAAMPAMSMAHETKNLADSFELTNKSVFFNSSWIPYNERANYLLEADLGVSTHFEHLETRFSFRTRLLDYIWAELPIVATAGDTFADIITQYTIGTVVPPNDSKKLAAAIEHLLDDPDTLSAMRNNLKQLQSKFHWENVVNPLENMVDDFKDRGRTKLTFTDLNHIANCAWKKLSPYSLACRTKIYLSQMLRS